MADKVWESPSLEPVSTIDGRADQLDTYSAAGVIMGSGVDM